MKPWVIDTARKTHAQPMKPYMARADTMSLWWPNSYSGQQPTLTAIPCSSTERWRVATRGGRQRTQQSDARATSCKYNAAADGAVALAPGRCVSQFTSSRTLLHDAAWPFQLSSRRHIGQWRLGHATLDLPPDGDDVEWRSRKVDSINFRTTRRTSCIDHRSERRRRCSRNPAPTDHTLAAVYTCEEKRYRDNIAQRARMWAVHHASGKTVLPGPWCGHQDALWSDWSRDWRLALHVPLTNDVIMTPRWPLNLYVWATIKCTIGTVPWCMHGAKDIEQYNEKQILRGHSKKNNPWQNDINILTTTSAS